MIDEIMQAADEWAKEQKQFHEWAPPTNEETKGQQAICQIRTEMEQFLTDLEKLNLLGGKICEIGMGLGGSHVVFRQCFKLVVTVEPITTVIEKFKRNNPNLKNEGIFYNGCSDEDEMINNVSGQAPYDVIFVDGDHSYEGALCDYCDYLPMLKDKGVMAWHDSKGDPRVTKFIDNLEAGVIDRKQKVYRIEHGQVAGISYIIKE